MRGGRDKKRPRSQTGASSLCWWRLYATGPSGRRPTTTDKNDHSSRTAQAEAAGTRKGPREGPPPLATLRAGKALRDEPKPPADVATRPTVAATESKGAGDPEPPSPRSDQPAEVPRQNGNAAARRQHSTQTGRHQEDCSTARPAAADGTSDQIPRSWPGW